MDVTFYESYQHTNTIWSFVFERPAGLVWTAGQSAKLEIPGAYGPLEHRFTIASVPADDRIIITTRLSGSMYKRRLQQLRPGDVARVYAVEGTFIWGDDVTIRRIFVAAGIGVTPFYAMLRQRQVDTSPMPVTLLYGTPDQDILYRTFFDELAQTHPEFSVQYIADRITAAVAAATADVSQSMVYVAGPGAMVDSVSDGLMADHGLSPEHLLRDWYSGNLPIEG